jgi:hypothetical protein
MMLGWQSHDVARENVQVNQKVHMFWLTRTFFPKPTGASDESFLSDEMVISGMNILVYIY